MSAKSQDIARIILDAILGRRLSPGAKLAERELSEIFKVSRIVVRQALIRLSEDGLVTIERNRGAFVAKPSLREAVEIYDALTILEQGIAAQLASRTGNSVSRELRAHLARQRQALDTHNHELSDMLGQEFHSLLVRLSQNHVVQEMHSQLVRRTALLRSLYRSEFDYCALQEDHERIIEHLEKGRIKQLQQLIAEHHRLVVRGYALDGESQPDKPLESIFLDTKNGQADEAALSNKNPAIANQHFIKRRTSKSAGRPSRRLVNS